MDVRYELKRKEASESKRLLCDTKHSLTSNQRGNYFLDAVFGVVTGLAVSHAYADAATLYFTPTAFFLGVTSVPVFMTRLLGESRANDLRSEIDSLENKIAGLKKYVR